MIGRRILGAKDQTPNDSADATATDQGRRAKGALPLPPDVVCLPGQNDGETGVSAHHDHKGADVAGRHIMDITEKGQA